MREEFLPFSRPSISEDEIDAIGAVLRSGWITTGKQVARLEADFCDYTGCGGAAALSSATAGMHVVLAALGIGTGDEVITPSLTWVSTVNLIVLAGATPVFADVDRETLMVTPESVERVLTPRTRLVVPVHYAGAAADTGPIREIVASRGIAVVEDAAHAVGTHYRGEHVGKRGTSIFSFHPIKNMTTAEGGMVCSDDPALLDRVRRLRFHGLGVDAFDRKVQGRSPQAEVQEPGWKYNLTDVQAALGVGQLTRIERFIADRTALAERYLQRLESVEEIRPLEMPDYPMRHAWHLMVVRLDLERAGMDRATFMEKLKQKNIGTGLHFRSVHGQEWYRQNLPQAPGSLDATEWNSERIFSLPLFPGMVLEDVDDVVTAVKEVLQEGGR